MEHIKNVDKGDARKWKVCLGEIMFYEDTFFIIEAFNILDKSTKRKKDYCDVEVSATGWSRSHQWYFDASDVVAEMIKDLYIHYDPTTMVVKAHDIIEQLNKIRERLEKNKEYGKI